MPPVVREEISRIIRNIEFQICVSSSTTQLFRYLPLDHAMPSEPVGHFSGPVPDINGPRFMFLSAFRDCCDHLFVYISCENSHVVIQSCLLARVNQLPLRFRQASKYSANAVLAKEFAQ